MGEKAGRQAEGQQENRCNSKFHWAFRNWEPIHLISLAPSVERIVESNLSQRGFQTLSLSRE